MSSLFPEMGQREPGVPRHANAVLASQDIRAMIDREHVTAPEPVPASNIQPASLDLRLGHVGHRVRASFLPGKRSPVQRRVADFAMHHLDLTRPTVLEKGCVYIIAVQEHLALPPDVWARANPKSTTGRLDVFTRLITDYGDHFDRVPAGYRGPLFVEVAPRTFSIVVRADDTLNQLRFVRGLPGSTDRQIAALHKGETLLYVDDAPASADISEGLRISIDLQPSGTDIAGYVAKRHTDLIDLRKRSAYDALDFWEIVPTPRRGTLILDPNEFYILASREAVRVPPAYAAELVAYDPDVGEFRVHYAGFFDPGFGYGDNDLKGARAVLEIRSHEVPFALENRQLVGRLRYERLTLAPEITYGRSIGSSYQGQGLMLSKQFRAHSSRDSTSAVPLSHTPLPESNSDR